MGGRHNLGLGTWENFGSKETGSQGTHFHVESNPRSKHAEALQYKICIQPNPSYGHFEMKGGEKTQRGSNTPCLLQPPITSMRSTASQKTSAVQEIKASERSPIKSPSKLS